MKSRILIIAIVVSSLFPSQALAVENGEDATGSSFVVPVIVDLGNGKSGGCTGTLIAESIVVTAGHCVLDADGLVTNNTLEDKIVSVKITSTFQNGSSQKVNDDDLAFLVLSKSQTVRIPLVLASDKEALDFKSAATGLKVVGYGSYSNVGKESITFPKSFSGTFNTTYVPKLNSDFVISTDGRACVGDSGSPILHITATRVTLVGILTGIQFGTGNQCGQKNVDGKYWSLFTLVGRYANLAFSAASDVMNSNQGKIAGLQSELSDLEAQLADATSAADEATTKLEEANTALAAFRKQLPKAILCSSAKATKTIVVLNSKCPSGYKKK
jgi:secreted trypsin-like serine protease